MYAEAYQPYLGKKSKLLSQVIEPGSIRRFADAVGETDPVYYDEEYAKNTPHGTIIAPPTFAFTLSYPDIPGIWFPSSGVVHVGSTFEVIRPLRAGETVLTQSVLDDVYEKVGRNGLMLFIVRKRSVFDISGNACFHTKSILLTRDKALKDCFPDDVRLPEPTEPAQTYEHSIEPKKNITDFSAGMVLEDVLLRAYTHVDIAKYAGASLDFNPIHVDDAAAKQAGFRGKLAHGMINTALLGRVCKQWFGSSSQIRSMDIRFKTPTYPGDAPLFRGSVTHIDRENNLISFSFAAENQSGDILLSGSGSVMIRFEVT